MGETAELPAAAALTGWGGAPRAFEEAAVGQLHADFLQTASAMDPLLQRVLLHDEVLTDGDETRLKELLHCSPLAAATRCVLRRDHIIGPEGCEALRRLVDTERDVTRDSVDNGAQHQLNISAERLMALVPKHDVYALWRLADEVLASQPDGGFYVDLFVRRYTRETRPWIAFHEDVSSVTINVALSDDDHHQGGRLHAILGGQHQTIRRREGEATAHSNDVTHAVSAMRSGVRYSLICFFYTLSDEPGSLEYQTIPKREIDQYFGTAVPVADASSSCAEVR